MSLEVMEKGHHVSDEMREPEGSDSPFSVEQLEAMGVPKHERDAYFAEYKENDRWREWELQKHREEFVMEIKTA